jgi:tRNA pseudouridine55 synthase
MNGIVVVDKPAGCTSHDVVQRMRRALGQRSVGHAGTLDPLATGVLVVAVGEATKLVSHLQSDDKRYEVSIALGTETDSLDADGKVTATADVPSLDAGDVEAALQSFIGRHPQKAPSLSAVKVAGTPLHRRVRRGEDALVLRLHCGKGFYVRSLARDLARALGTVGHVRSLRRTASGRFSLARALHGDELSREAVAERLIPLREACSLLPRATLTERGVADARHGRPIVADAVTDDAWREASPQQTLALFGPNGEPVALGRRAGDGIRVVRGFTEPSSDVVNH